MVLSILSSIFISNGFAAACCSGGSNQVSIMTGDLSSQIKMQYSNAAVIADVNASRQVTDRDSSLQEVTENFELQYNYRLAELWQLGVSIPIVQKTKETVERKEQSRGIGDIALQISYEVLPELEYSLWKPKGFLFTSIKLPVAHSAYDSQEPLQTDAIGKGFYQGTLGALFVKRWQRWEFLAIPSFTWYRPEAYQVEQRIREIRPGMSSSFRYGVSYSLPVKPIILAIFHNLKYEAKTKVEDIVASASSYSQDLSINVSYDWQQYSLSAFYSDQKILGFAKNTSLETTFGFQLTRLYEL